MEFICKNKTCNLHNVVTRIVSPKHILVKGKMVSEDAICPSCNKYLVPVQQKKPQGRYKRPYFANADWKVGDTDYKDTYAVK